MNKYENFFREVGRREKNRFARKDQNISANAKKQYKN